jgi:hypothetical protein
VSLESLARREQRGALQRVTSRHNHASMRKEQ